MQTEPPPTAGGPLRGLKILDLTQLIAGPYATKLLADYGADVTKVEPGPDGDPARDWQPPCPGGPEGPHSAFFSFLNTNKRSVGVDIRTPEGREILLALARQADVVVESFRPGVLDRLGVGYAALAAQRPDAILLSISNYGQKGTFKDYPATELTIFALGGRMAASGTRPQPPVRLLGGSSLFMAGTVAAHAAVVAVRGRRRDGAGDHIDVAIANVILGQPDRGLCLYSYSGINMERPDGPRPFQTFPAADGFVVINVNRGIERVAEMIGRPEMAQDPRFLSNVARQEHASELEALIIEWTVAHTKEEIVEASNRYRVIAAPVSTVPEILANEHLRAREFFRAAPGALCPCQRNMPGPPFRVHTMPGGGWRLRAPAPAFGAHTMDVLDQLGVDAGDIGKLRRAGVVFGPESGASEKEPA